MATDALRADWNRVVELVRGVLQRACQWCALAFPPRFHDARGHAVGVCAKWWDWCLSKMMRGMAWRLPNHLHSLQTTLWFLRRHKHSGVNYEWNIPPPPCISHALVQATVGVGTVTILYVI